MTVWWHTNNSQLCSGLTRPEVMLAQAIEQWGRRTITSKLAAFLPLVSSLWLSKLLLPVLPFLDPLHCSRPASQNCADPGWSLLCCRSFRSFSCCAGALRFGQGTSVSELYQTSMLQWPLVPFSVQPPAWVRGWLRPLTSPPTFASAHYPGSWRDFAFTLSV